MSERELYRIGPPKSSRWQRALASVRAITLGPYNAKDPALARLFSGGPVRSGVAVNETTAMNYAAVWAAVNIVSASVSSVPLALYKTLGEGRGKEEFRTHSTYRLIHDQPNPQMGSMIFRRTLQAHAMVWGNGYAEIVRDGGLRPKELWPLNPAAVQPFTEGGRLRYRCHNASGGEVVIESADMLHIRGLSHNGISGYPTIGGARESIGLGMAAEQFGSTFFGNGSTFGGIIKYPAGVAPSPQTRKDNAEALARGHQGVDKAHKLLAIYEGADFQALGVPPNAAQFLETRQFQIEEVCRWFNVNPHKLHHLLRTSYNSIEHLSIEYDTDTLNPWWVTWEQELQNKLVMPLEQNIQKIEHNRKGRLQADAASRGTFYQTRFNVGSLTPNDIRGLENENPISGGEQAFVMTNLIPLELARDYWQAQIDKMGADAEAARRPPPAPVAPKPEADAEEEVKALREQVELARKMTQLAEDKADMALADLASVRATTAEAVALAQAETARTVGELELTARTLVAAEQVINHREESRRVACEQRDAAVNDLDATAWALEDVTVRAVRAEQAALDLRASADAIDLARVAALCERDETKDLAAEAVRLRDDANREAVTLAADLEAVRAQYAELDAMNKGATALADKYLAERDRKSVV